ASQTNGCAESRWHGRSVTLRFFFSSRRRHTRWPRDWSSDVCSSDLVWTVFWWDGDALRTPALELGILPGIGRARVLELVKRVVQGRYPAQELAGKSLFLTNAVRGIVPIASLDGVAVPADPRTAELAERFWPTM